MLKREPSRLEMQVLGVLWDRGPSTVRDVLERLPDRKTRAYTTVLTVMQVMEKKGLVTHGSQGNTHVYRPAISRRRAVGPMLRDLLRNLFGGSPASAMQHLLDESEVSRDELEKLKQLIAERERQVGGGKSGSPARRGKHE